jgi:hypothetical protein
MGGKHSRNKGATFERWVADEFTRALGGLLRERIQRNIGQARDGGDDITVGDLRVECKRYAKMGFYPWLKQVQAAADITERVVVVAKADNEPAVAIIPFEQFLLMESAYRIAPLFAPRDTTN